MPLDAPVTSARFPASTPSRVSLCSADPLSWRTRCLGGITQDRKLTHAEHSDNRGTRRVRLLVSVRDADEARSAIEGGAAIIDAKEPSRGALGAVELPVLRAIRDTVGDACPLSAALGDADDDASLADAAHGVGGLG